MNKYVKINANDLIVLLDYLFDKIDLCYKIECKNTIENFKNRNGLNKMEIL